MNEGILSVTSFSLLRKGSITQFPYSDFNKRTSIQGDYSWPNEISSFRDASNQLVILIPDGFLMPGQNNGALYAIRNPGKKKSSSPVCITASKPGWFYHRAVFIELSNGKKGILTARAKKPLFSEGMGELVWLNMPESSSLHEENWWDASSEGENSAWEETVLVEGPDVMFEVIHNYKGIEIKEDRKKEAEEEEKEEEKEDCFTVCAAHFFGKKLSIHTLQAMDSKPYVKIIDSVVMDTVGRPYGLCLTTMPSEISTASSSSLLAPKLHQVRHRESNTASIVAPSISYSSQPPPTHLLVSTHECSYDFPKALQMVKNTLNYLHSDYSFPRFLSYFLFLSLFF